MASKDAAALTFLYLWSQDRAEVIVLGEDVHLAEQA